MKTVGIIGGSGYTGGELIRLVLQHPKLQLDFVYSTTRPGKHISSVHTDLLWTDFSFTGKVNPNVDIVFLCLGHGNSKVFLEENNFPKAMVIIDLSNEFRLDGDQNFKGRTFVYGLPESRREAIREAHSIANPGCFATAVQLALLPLAAKNKLSNEVHINATTGSTGAGVGLSKTTHFTWRNNNLSWYKPFVHQHLGEVRQTLSSMSTLPKLYFLPQRGTFTRGIFATAYTSFKGDLKTAKELYERYYESHPFVQISQEEINLKQVVNTNFCVLHLHLYEGLLLITSVIDNLIKGASGQAIQNTNILMGWEETTGLHLKGSIF